MLINGSSVYAKCEGGGFSKAGRFQSHSKSNIVPGPDYDLGSFTDDKIRGPVYTKIDRPNLTVMELSKTLPHPNKDRTSFMIGTIKNDMAYTSSVSTQIGPAAYAPDMSVVKHTYPRNAFGKDPRFQALTKQYLNKELNTINYCTAGPGPKYLVDKANIDLDTPIAPSYSFRSKGDNVSDRSSFLSKSMKVGVGPSKYSPNLNVVTNTVPRPILGRADRFKPVDKLYMGHKYVKDKAGLHSPGPKYYSTVGEINASLHPGIAGKWTPY